ncbi:MAG: ATP-binding cassette domain-containing protein [Propioniciclava sp.]|uniref:ATP-binding cassette domain-containing protein n=1 Tax=Propioniciclava sp. TaxID=2038686 RepID=UPI0039E53821
MSVDPLPPAPRRAAGSVALTAAEPTRAAHTPQVDQAVPAIRAVRLRAATPRGVVFDHLDVTVPAGSVVAVAGPSGVGKSALLLALTGRLRGLSGELTVAGRDGIKHPAQVRAVTSVARIAGLIEPEGSLTIEECITERTLADAAPARSRHAHFLHAARLLGLDVAREELMRTLTPADQTRAAVALACIRPASVVVLDDLDHHATLAEQRDLWAGLSALAADGCTVVAATSERDAIPASALVIDLDPAREA